MSDSNSVVKNAAFRVTENPLEIKGFVHGLRHPCLIVRLTVTVQNQNQWLTEVNNVLADAIQRNFVFYEKLSVSPDDNKQRDAVQSLFFWISKLQEVVKVPVFESAKVIGFDSKTTSLLIAVPTISSFHISTGKLFFWLLKVFNGVYSGDDVHRFLKELPLVIKQQEQMVPRASNMLRFVRTAFILGIPYAVIADQIYQFGYSSRSRFLDSSFTDQTSRLGAWFARNKALAAAMLRISGIPVPDHKIVPDVKSAEQAACELGFPVVVKPADLDGGVGVAAGLTTLEEVREAFAAAQKKSKTILVEKHHDGRDYRLTVFQNELIWAVERIPGGVTGDGKHSVQLLVEQLNKDPRRGEGTHSPLKRLVLDNEARSLLSKIGMSPESVPESGEFVSLRRTANVANGGMPVAVFDNVHPDNRLLAIRAAAVLHLDLAGIDLLIPDISRSWRESGAVICEVNAQPDLGETTTTRLYPQILHKLVEGRGRIPIAVVIGASPELDLAAAVAAKLSEAGFTTGRVDHEGASIGTVTITARDTDPYTAGRILLGEKGVDALVLCINDMSVFRTGLPFDRFDLLVFAGSHFSKRVPQRSQTEAVQLRTFFNVFSPGCDGKVLVVAEPVMAVPEPFNLLPEELLKRPVAQHQIVVAISDALIEAEVRHRI